MNRPDPGAPGNQPSRPTPPHLPPVNRRRHGRVRTLDVQCSLGEVVDISASGMRVCGRGKPVLPQGVATTITLATPAGMLAVDIGVAWVRRVGLRGWEMGLEFIAVTPDVIEGVRAVLRGAAVGPVETESTIRRRVA